MNSLPRITYGDINTERRSAPLVSLNQMQTDLSTATSILDELLTYCSRVGVWPGALKPARQFLTQQTKAQAAFYGDEDGHS